MAASTSAPSASPTPSEPGQLRDMATIDVPRSNRRKKSKSELSFSFGSTSSGSSPSAFNVQASLPELPAPVSLLALFAVLQKADQSERQCVIPESARQAAASQFRSTDEALPTPPKLPNDKRKPRWRSIEHSSERQRKASMSKFAESDFGFIGGEAIVLDETEATPLAELDAVMFGRDHEVPCGRTVRPRRTTCWKR
ncbi:hypothetical protein HPB52_015794 [Rhipicephalus sanguineus]|uniref:Uncharacterized protein n=1 Tax=Rhipicephalus sanguineus TaxID=34632 RepID=A0A9D4SUM3_RHISA|nr:hypothetical protein HPB52_015794 [Rhipicephalus sanguineus]